MHEVVCVWFAASWPTKTICWGPLGADLFTLRAKETRSPAVDLDWGLTLILIVDVSIGATVTGPERPPSLAISTSIVPLAPRPIVSVGGLTDSAKSGGSDVRSFVTKTSNVCPGACREPGVAGKSVDVVVPAA